MNLLDKTIGLFSPGWAVERVAARATLQQIDAMSGGKSGYDSGKVNRFTKSRMAAPLKENAVPVSQLEHVRSESWNLWRNNRYAKKIVRSLTSKVIGRGMVPESLATLSDGAPHLEFRAKVKELWKGIQTGLDARGMPGQGGQTFVGMQKLAFRSVILSGEVLNRLIPILPDKQQQRELPIPVLLQTIDASRLIESNDTPKGESLEGTALFRGIEYDTSTGERRRYWLSKYQAGGTAVVYGTAEPIPAEQINHLFVEEDTDQMRGTGWFASAILQTRDTDDLQYNVLKASAMAACIVLGYRKPTGAARFGLNASSEASSTSTDGTDLTDEDGNSVTKIQPGMFVNLGKDGALDGFSPNQPNTNAEAFIQHMLRGIAAGLPGIKGSTLTGDYRQSSFSSERAADNDCWPEIQDVQDWFSSHFCQPIFAAIIKVAVRSGFFDGIVSADEFSADPTRFLEMAWQGPVVQSINPVDDINAAGLRMKFCLSSLQMECAKLNVNWIDVLNQIAELYEIAKEKGIPEEVVNNILGVDSQDVIAATNAAKAQATNTNPTENGHPQGDGAGDQEHANAKKEPVNA